MGWNTLLRDISASLIAYIFKNPVLASSTGVKGYIQVLFQQFGFNAWWECFLLKIVENLSQEGNLKVFRATDSLVQDFEKLIPSSREKMKQSGLIIFDDQKNEMHASPKLTLCSLIQLYDGDDCEVLSQLSPESRQGFFALMNKYLNDWKSCTDGENQKIRKMLLRKPIFRCYHDPSEALNSLACPHYKYSFSKDPESILGFRLPNQEKKLLSIPEISVIIADDPEAELLFRKLDLMKCTADYIINHIQAHHAAFFGNPHNQGINKDQYHQLEQHIWYLYHKQDCVLSIVSACDPPFPVLFFPGAVGGSVLSAKQAVLPCFLGLQVSMCSAVGTEPWQTNLLTDSFFRKIQDHQELCRFQLFLLEMGCDLPSERRLIGPSINESFCSPIFGMYADSALLDIRRVDSKLVSDKLKNMTVVERIK